MKKAYIDTNIFLNIFFDEEEFYSGSKRLFDMVEEKSIIGVISIFVLMELVRVLQKSAFSADKINDVIVKIKGLNVEIVIPSEFHLITAYELLIELGLDILDALHLCVAIDVADIFVTRDTKLARKIADKIEVMTPEEVKR